MDKNIYQLQNQDVILKSLVVQSKLYSKAKQINCLYLLSCVLLPIGYSIIKGFLSGEFLITAGALLTIALIFIAPALSSLISEKKKTAAKTQQTIDFLLFEDDTFKSRDDDWGEFYTKDEICELIAKTKINQKDIDKKQNWYNDYSSYPHVMQSYYAQCECVRWDGDLRKAFAKFCYIFTAILFVAVLIIAVVLKMTVCEFIINLATFAPLIKHLVPLRKKLNADLNRLNNISHIQRTISNQFGRVIGAEELYAKIIKIQKQVFEHRANALMIPDFFYKFMRKKQQSIEDKISAQKVGEDKL